MPINFSLKFIPFSVFFCSRTFSCPVIWLWPKRPDRQTCTLVLVERVENVQIITCKTLVITNQVHSAHHWHLNAKLIMQHTHTHIVVGRSAISRNFLENYRKKFAKYKTGIPKERGRSGQGGIIGSSQCS